MTEDDDWNFEEETTTDRPKTLLVICLVAVVIIAGLGSFLVLRDDEDEFPSEAKAPKLHAGMDWWYHQEENNVDHETGDNETIDYGFTMLGIIGLTSHGGKEAYVINWFDVIDTTTRHSSNNTGYITVQDLNGLDDDGNEYVSYDFPLKDGKKWNWIDDDGNNRSYICKEFRDVKTLDGTYNTYRVRMTYTEEGTDWSVDYRNDYYYSPELGYMVKGVFRYDFYDNGELTSTITRFINLVSHGTSDSDGDGISDAGEIWFGTDPNRRDTDSDGLIDSVDFVPLFDLGLTINLTHIRTDEDVESVDEVTLFGEEEGADFFFDFSNNDNDDVLTTDPIENTDTSDLDITYKINLSDNFYHTRIEIRCFDADDGNDDDEMDITIDNNHVTLILEFNIYERSLEIRDVDPPDGKLELNVEQEVYGNGNGDYDATLRFIVSEVDMENFN